MTEWFGQPLPCFDARSDVDCQAVGKLVGNPDLRCPTAEACTLRREYLQTKGLDPDDYYLSVRRRWLEERL